MGRSVKVRVDLSLMSHWLTEHNHDKNTPIATFIEAFCQYDPDVEVIDQKDDSCSLITHCEQDCEYDIELLVEVLLQDNLGIEEDDDNAQWSVSVVDQEDNLNVATTPFQIHLVFEDEWVLNQREEHSLPVDLFLERLLLLHDNIQVKDQGLTYCTVIVQASLYNDLQEEAELILAEMGATNGIIELSVFEEALSSVDTCTEANECTTDHNLSIISQINNLIGANDFKDLCYEISSIAPQIIMHKTHATFAAQAYLFSIGDSCGISTYLNLLAELIDEEKLFPFTAGNKILELPSDQPLAEMLENATESSFTRQICCFDISEWMDKVTQPEFRSFLQKLSKHQGQQLFAFRIPLVDEFTRHTVVRALSDILLIRKVVVTPFTSDELHIYAKRILSEKGFTIKEDAWPIFDERVIEEKSDSRFYGFKTVQKVVNELIYQKHLATVKQNAPPKNQLYITASDIEAIITDKPDNRSAMEQLNCLIGIESIKNQFLEVIAQIKLMREEKMFEAPCLHMLFVGNPGTGKTTVARILGKLLKEHGILSKGKFFEYTGRDFCGEYIGQTAPKTASMCRDAYGSVLFIDEAYSLYRGSKNDSDFGREAIDTLIAQMENHRNDFIIIMAGYHDEMDYLMEANIGLKSRMPYLIEFPNYTRDELYQIFISMIDGNFDYEAALKTVAKEYFNSLSDEVLDEKEFANARFVRNLFERTWGKAAMRHQMEPNTEFSLCACDFDKAAAEREFSQLQKKRARRIGF